MTMNAINYLTKLGCSHESLKPYNEHLEYLEGLLKSAWNEFKLCIEQDEVRVKMCNEINWMPKYGCKYQEIISDPDFRKRWSYFDVSFENN
jgi:hypothetical protein